MSNTAKAVHPFFQPRTPKNPSPPSSQPDKQPDKPPPTLKKKKANDTVNSPPPDPPSAPAAPQTVSKRIQPSRRAKMDVDNVYAFFSTSPPPESSPSVVKAKPAKPAPAKALVAEASVAEAPVTRASKAKAKLAPKLVPKPAPIFASPSITATTTAKAAKAAKAKATAPATKTTAPVTKTTAPATKAIAPAARSKSQHVYKGECSTPYYVPITKPKFFSDTIEYQKQLEYESSFNYFGRIPSLKQKKTEDHEFSRLNRHIYGNGHVTDKVFEPPVIRWQDQKRPQTNLCQLIKDHQQSFFEQTKILRQRRQSHHRRNQQDTAMTASIADQAELKAYLDTHFPHWNKFSSCVLLMQSIFSKSGRPENGNKQWTDKYRPKHLNGLLGERHNLVYIKDWLHQMKVEPLSAPKDSGTTSKRKKKIGKKSRKLAISMEDDDDEDMFLKSLSLHEDEEDDDDDFVIKPSSAKRPLEKESMRSNIILLSGDHGIGKTATVYTIAEQMGYEVFEMNAGSRRCGKDLMSEVGEMTKSHLVAFNSPSTLPSIFSMSKPAQKKATDEKTKKKKLNPLFKPTPITKSEKKPATKDLLNHFVSKKEPPAKPVTASSTRQSLILLEEVDLMFEEDKGFWAALVELSQKSKRPIVMTCNDSELVPLESLCLQAALDIKPPTESELLPYLWLVCFAEGYQVDPADLICLVAFLGRDIRQLLQTLQLYAGKGMFGQYLGIGDNMSLADIKMKSVPSKLAINTFQLVRAYESLDDNRTLTHSSKDTETDDLEAIVRALKDNAFIDTWLEWRENGNLIQEDIQDQVNGYTSLWFEDDEDSEAKLMNEQLGCIVSVLNSDRLRCMDDWFKVILDEDGHWDELCDARSANFEDYREAVEKVLPLTLVSQPNESILMMDYIPNIQRMLLGSALESKTRSKRRRLYLPLSQDATNTLANQRVAVDETDFYVQRLSDLKKEE